MVTTLRINGYDAAVTIDTGSSLGFEIYEASVDELGLRKAMQGGSEGTARGARGEFELKTATVERIELGGIVITIHHDP